MKKQLIVISDMEGASGIFEDNRKELINGTSEWRKSGRKKMTSDVLAVCEAANESGIDEIMYYDMHFAGNREYNVELDKLPDNVKLFDVPDRRFFWRRIRGQACIDPYGIITVGQHARYGEEHAYFPHTIQSPPIKGLWVNGLHIAEIGSAVLNFRGSKYIANIGCAASMKEAKELSGTVHHISVKDKKSNWEPSYEETFDLIKTGVKIALSKYDDLDAVDISGPFKFRMELWDGYNFVNYDTVSWKGWFEGTVAYWEAPSFEIGSEIFNYVRNHVIKDSN